MSRVVNVDFGVNLSGYLFRGKNANDTSPLIVVEEGSGMHVMRYGIGKYLNSGITAPYDGYIIWLHSRRSSIEAKDVLNSTYKIQEYLSGNHDVFAVGFSNGAASITDALAKEPTLFKAICSAGGYAKNLNGIRTDCKMIFLCNTKAPNKNFDTVGKFINSGIANTQGYFYNVNHSSLEPKAMSPKMIEYITGDWKIGYDGEQLTRDGRCNGQYIYHGMKKGPN